MAKTEPIAKNRNGHAMDPLTPAYLALLRQHLAGTYVGNLPALAKNNRNLEETAKKNLSRAFSAFALHHLTGVSEKDAAQSVVDDFEDVGLDAIYYFASTETLYLVQSKLKASEEFRQDEALAFCQGVRKLITQDFSGFNEHVTRRRTEIDGALELCSKIQLVVAHTGSGISKHARTAIDELLLDETHDEVRLNPPLLDFHAAKVVEGLQGSKARKRVDTRLVVRHCKFIAEPRPTYIGLVNVKDLIDLHKVNKEDLYDKNIRTFLGHQTDVNKAIQKTLAERPDHFLYLNNGVTVLCEKIEQKNTIKKEGRRLIITGFSVVNGAQTIASSAKFMADNPATNIDFARVSITLIEAATDSAFGKSVTRARNHQNEVKLSNFAALDDTQERLRRDLALLDVQYAYKAGRNEGPDDPNRIQIEEAVQALALLQGDPRYAVRLKKQPADLLDVESAQYRALFGASVTAFQLLNAVLLNRYIQRRIGEEVGKAKDQERLVYRHGNHVIAWILAKRTMKAINEPIRLNDLKLNTVLSTPFDELRQKQWDLAKPALAQRGPLSLFRNQTHTIPLMQEIMIGHYGLTIDPVIPHKIANKRPDDPYPADLFAYLIQKAPQIEGLS
jgi:hypothetical protein